jgi:DNA/RNA-binding domain of Phe-tRNA-synthetase-like protein
MTGGAEPFSRFRSVGFSIDEAVTRLGVRGVYLAMGGLSNRESDPAFDALREQVLEDLRAGLSAGSLRDDPVLAGFRRLHTAVGVSNRKNVAAPENLLRHLLRTGELPRVNLLVDIYNLVSLRTRLALGAHDLARAAGDLRLRLTDGTERFVPLGAPEPKAVAPGEYAYVDGENEVLCRLEVRQVEKTRVGLDASACFYIVQGHEATGEDLLRAASEELIALTTRFCGGEARLLSAPWL